MENKKMDAKSLNEILDNSETKKKALQKIIKGLDTSNKKTNKK